MWVHLGAAWTICFLSRYEVVLAAVEHNAEALKDASAELKGNRNIVAAALAEGSRREKNPESENPPMGPPTSQLPE
eukprot:2688935-Amphidinium_carterae.1